MSTPASSEKSPGDHWAGKSLVLVNEHHICTDTNADTMVFSTESNPNQARGSKGKPNEHSGDLTTTSTYTGIPRETVRPVFKAACRLRFENTTAENLIRITKTNLDVNIVDAILEAAFRLVPPDDTPNGVELRRAQAAEKARKAERAEHGFIDCLRVLDPNLLRENQLQERIRESHAAGRHDTVNLTPDALFSKPTMVCGNICNWVEYKNTFGFSSSPFVAQKNKKQFKRYAEAFGPGVVVYKLGYEKDHVKIDGVSCFREADLLQWLQDI